MKLYTGMVLMGLVTNLIVMNGNILSAQEEQRNCTVISADLTKVMYSVFDQELDSPLSWRCVANGGDFRQAQELINKYIMVNTGKLDQYEVRNLFFHSGQLAAIDGRYEDAVDKFHLAIDHKDGTVHQLSWNEYVSGTIYFLQGDVNKLEQEIKKIEAENLEVDVYNLRILKNFIRYPNDTYQNVYSRTSSCLNNGSQLD